MRFIEFKFVPNKLLFGYSVEKVEYRGRKSYSVIIYLGMWYVSILL